MAAEGRFNASKWEQDQRGARTYFFEAERADLTAGGGAGLRGDTAGLAPAFEALPGAEL